MPVETTCREFEELGLFECKIGGTVKSVRCIRPWQIQPEEVPSDVKVTSNAFLEWRTQLLPAGVPLELSLPKESRWAAVIDGMFLYSHNRGAHVTSRRFATVSNATIRRRNAEDREVQFHFVSQTSGEPAAIGFETHVDGLRLLVAVPQGPVVDRTSTSTGKVRSFRSAYLRHLILNDDELGKHANKFQREWLYQIYFSALTAYALGQPTSLEIANRALFGDVLDRAAKKVLDAIFETSDVLAMEREQEEAEGTEAPEEPSEDDNARSGRLVASIRALFHEEVVGVRLRTLAEALWAPLSDEAMVWASERDLSTVGSAVLAACTELYPEAVTSDLLLDIDPGYRAPDDTPIPPGVSEIWITEATLGGGGVLEEIARRYVDDPRRFFRLLESCLGPSDHEMVDSELTRLLLSIPEDEELAATMEAVRAAEGHAALSSAVSRLEDGMAARGLAVSHAVMAALHARILRPGSSARTDHFLRSLISQWQAEEVRLGVELDSRVFAYVASASQEASTALADLEGYSTDPARSDSMRFTDSCGPGAE
ncbi:MAG: hypothetical protein IPG75_20825 [Gemmatimonadetes bacterium]|nr:hypothetical protein [Gemmatimonadota bacterium]